jgi:hypothetical protein
MIAGACAWSRESQRNAMEASTTTTQGRKRPWIAPAHTTPLRRPLAAVEADARIVDGCHGGRDSDYAVARDHRAHELCRRQAQASSGEHAPGRRRRAVKYERVYHGVPEVRIAAFPSEVGAGQVMSWSRCLAVTL